MRLVSNAKYVILLKERLYYHYYCFQTSFVYVTPNENAASHPGLYCLLKEISLKNE